MNSKAPGILPSYGRAALAALPFAGRLPFLPGGGGALPEAVRTLEAASVPPATIQELRALTGDGGGPSMPLLLPHFLAFPLHMQAITDGAFPYPAIGTVHLDNHVERHRVVTSAEPLDVAVRLLGPFPHRKGATFQIETTALAAGQLIWRELSTNLRIGARVPEGAAELPSLDVSLAEAPPADAAAVDWTLPADLGRRWAAASGDRNPIHLSGLSAKAFGFPRAIAHGMWTAARIAADLGGELPEAVAFSVRFEKPILLPGEARLRHWPSAGGTDLLVTSAAGDRIHARGRVTPL